MVKDHETILRAFTKVACQIKAKALHVLQVLTNYLHLPVLSENNFIKTTPPSNCSSSIHKLVFQSVLALNNFRIGIPQFSLVLDCIGMWGV